MIKKIQFNNKYVSLYWHFKGVFFLKKWHRLALIDHKTDCNYCWVISRGVFIQPDECSLFPLYARTWCYMWALSGINLPSSEVSVFLTVLNFHDASSVIAFGTSTPCHFSATNVTELWPKPDILYSASSLIWLQWYHIWDDLIRGLQGQ